MFQGKLSVQMEKHYNNPHNFGPFVLNHPQYECSYCHHFIKEKEGELSLHVSIKLVHITTERCVVFIIVHLFLYLRLQV